MSIIGKEYITENELQTMIKTLNKENDAIRYQFAMEARKDDPNAPLPTRCYTDTYRLAFNKTTDSLELTEKSHIDRDENLIIMTGAASFFVKVNNYMHRKHFVESNEPRRKWDSTLIGNDLLNCEFKPEARNLFVVANAKSFKVSIVQAHEYKREMGHIIYNSYSVDPFFGPNNTSFFRAARDFMETKEDKYINDFALSIRLLMRSKFMRNILAYTGTESIFVGMNSEQLDAIIKLSGERELRPYEVSIPDNGDFSRRYEWLENDRPWAEVLREIENPGRQAFVKKFLESGVISGDIHNANYKGIIDYSDVKFTVDKAPYGHRYTHLFNKDEVIRVLNFLYDF